MDNETTATQKAKDNSLRRIQAMNSKENKEAIKKQLKTLFS